MFSGALGLAKCLKNRDSSPIPPDGPLDGFLGKKFVLAFLASVVVLVSRGFLIGVTWVRDLLQSDKLLQCYKVWTLVFYG